MHKTAYKVQKDVWRQRNDHSDFENVYGEGPS